MKAIDDFLSYLRGLNVRVWSEGDRLHYRAPKGTLSAAALAEMQERKAEILEFCRKAKMETAAALSPLATRLTRGGSPSILRPTRVVVSPPA